MIQVTCPGCDRKLRLDDTLAGKKVRCPTCRAVCAVPAPEPPVPDLMLPEDLPARRPVITAELAEPEPHDAEPVEEPRPRRRLRDVAAPPSTFRWVGLIVALVAVVFGGVAFFVAYQFSSGLVSGLLGRGPVLSWRAFSPPGSGYTVDMPGEPVENNDNLPPGSRKFVLIKASARMIFIAAHLDAPDMTPTAGNLRMLLAAEKDLMLEKTKGKVISEVDVTLGGVAGKEVRLQAADGSVITERVYLRPNGPGSRCYIIAAGGMGNDPATARFLASYRFLDGPGAPPAPPPPPPPAPPPVVKPKPSEDRPIGPPSPEGLLAYWSLDEGEGETIGDSLKRCTGKGVGTRWVAGRRGKALEFDGTSAYCDLGASPALNFKAGQDVSVTAWVKTEDTDGTIFLMRHTSDGGPALCLMVEGGRLVGLIREDGGELRGPALIRGGQVNDGGWHNVRLSRDCQADRVSLYLDGALQGSMAARANGAAGPITTNLRALGSERYWVMRGQFTPARQHLRGVIDEVCVHGGATPPPPKDRPRPPRGRPSEGERPVWKSSVSDRPFALAFFPDSRRLAVGQFDHRLRTWDAKDGAQLTLTEKLGGPLQALAVRGDGKQVAFGIGQGTVILWDVEGNKEEGRFRVEHRRDTVNIDFQSMAYSPDGKALAVGIQPPSKDGEVHLWSLEEKKVLASMRELPGTPRRLTFVAGGNLGVVVNHAIRLCDGRTLKVIQEIKQANGRERALFAAVSPDGKRVAAVCEDKKLRIWGLPSGELMNTWPTAASYHAHVGFPLVFSPDGGHVAFGAMGNRLWLIDVKTGKEASRQMGWASSGFVGIIAFSPDGALIATQGYNGPQIIDTAPLRALLTP